MNRSFSRNERKYFYIHIILNVIEQQNHMNWVDCLTHMINNVLWFQIALVALNSVSQE